MTEKCSNYECTLLSTNNFLIYYQGEWLGWKLEKASLESLYNIVKDDLSNYRDCNTNHSLIKSRIGNSQVGASLVITQNEDEDHFTNNRLFLTMASMNGQLFKSQSISKYEILPIFINKIKEDEKFLIENFQEIEEQIHEKYNNLLEFLLQFKEESICWSRSEMKKDQDIMSSLDRFFPNSQIDSNLFGSEDRSKDVKVMIDEEGKTTEAIESRGISSLWNIYSNSNPDFSKKIMSVKEMDLFSFECPDLNSNQPFEKSISQQFISHKRSRPIFSIAKVRKENLSHGDARILKGMFE